MHFHVNFWGTRYLVVEMMSNARKPCIHEGAASAGFRQLMNWTGRSWQPCAHCVKSIRKVGLDLSSSSSRILQVWQKICFETLFILCLSTLSYSIKYGSTCAAADLLARGLPCAPQRRPSPPPLAQGPLGKRQVPAVPAPVCAHAVRLHSLCTSAAKGGWLPRRPPRYRLAMPSASSAFPLLFFVHHSCPFLLFFFPSWPLTSVTTSSPFFSFTIERLFTCLQILHFEVYNLVVFCMFTKLQNCHHDLIPECRHHHRKEPPTHRQSPSIPLSSPASGSRSPTFCLHGFPFSVHFIQMESLFVAFFLASFTSHVFTVHPCSHFSTCVNISFFYMTEKHLILEHTFLSIHQLKDPWVVPAW